MPEEESNDGANCTRARARACMRLASTTDLKVGGIRWRRFRAQARARGRVGPGGQGPGVRDQRAAEKNRENVPAAGDTLSLGS